jgi:hypothetical protein
MRIGMIFIEFELEAPRRGLRLELAGYFSSPPFFILFMFELVFVALQL